MALQMSSNSSCCYSAAATSLSFRPSGTPFISNNNNNVSLKQPGGRFKSLVLFIKKSPKRLLYAYPRLPKIRYRNWMKHYQLSSQINMRLSGVWVMLLNFFGDLAPSSVGLCGHLVAEHGLLYIEVDPEGADSWKLDAAVEFLKNGAVGVIPTDTILKEVETGKASINYIIIFDDIYTTGFPCGNSYGFSGYFLAVKHCVPGPYTFILTASKALPKQCVLLPKKKTLGVCIPDDVVCQAVLDKMGAPLISTSVRSLVENQGILDPVLIADTYGPVGLDLVIDAGGESDPFTVVDMMRIPPKVIRQGKGPKQQWMVEEDSATEERD